jgi:hypothetical protein
VEHALKLPNVLPVKLDMLPKKMDHVLNLLDVKKEMVPVLAKHAWTDTDYGLPQKYAKFVDQTLSCVNQELLNLNKPSFLVNQDLSKLLEHQQNAKPQKHNVLNKTMMENAKNATEQDGH